MEKGEKVKMLTLTCLIVGEGSVFAVEIEENKMVSILKDEIKKKKTIFEQWDADQLTLYMAKKNGKKNGAYIIDDDEDPDLQKLSNRDVVQDILDAYMNKDTFMKGTWKLKKYFNNDTPDEGIIHILVKLPPNKRIPERTEADESKRARYENPVQASYGFYGITSNQPRIHRNKFRNDILNAIQSSPHVLLTSPSASGKTSLLWLIAEYYKNDQKVEVIYIPGHQDEIVSLNTIFYQAADQGTTIIMIDDAQKRYDDGSFWESVFRDQNIQKFKKNTKEKDIKFIIASTHALPGQYESPVEFASISKKFLRKDFLLDSNEANEFLSLPSPIGLPKSMQNMGRLKNMIIQECNGLLGGLRIAAELLLEFSNSFSNCTEDEMITYYMSKEFINRMARCFGSAHRKMRTNEKNILISCLVRGQCRVPDDINDDERKYYINLVKSGILCVNEEDCYAFTSMLATRYFMNEFFPKRAAKSPDSLQSLIKDVIKNISATELQNSVVEKSDFPNEYTFQHMVFGGLIEFTPLSCSVCPELSKLVDAAEGKKMTGAIDFFLNGNLRFGIELLVKGDRIGEHLSRFEGGKYQCLNCKDYAVIDFRPNTGGVFKRYKNKYTILFEKDPSTNIINYKTCTCFFGENETPNILELKD